MIECYPCQSFKKYTLTILQLNAKYIMRKKKQITKILVNLTKNHYKRLIIFLYRHL